MYLRRQTGVRAYLAAVLLAAAAFLVRLILDPVLNSRGPFLIFVIAVAGASLLGGWRPGLIATALSAISGIWFFVEPRHRFYVVGLEQWVYLIVFLTESTAFCALAGWLRNVQDQRQVALENERAARERAESAASAAADELRMRRIAEQELLRSNEDLERFAFVVSHDIKEPLRTIEKDAREIFSSPMVAAELAPNIVSITENVQVLIADLLAYARIDHVPVDSIIPVHLEDVLLWTKANLAALIQESSAQITSTELPAVYADFGALSQLFQNLLSNAIKYRSQTPPRINISAEQSGDSFTISVQDNGIGIDPADAEAVFTVFKRLHGREVPGTGIGLSICRRIVRRLGGSIWMEPRPKGGSSFRFTIPGALISDETSLRGQQSVANTADSSACV